MEIFNIKTNELIPYRNNAKRHNKKQVEQVANSIKRFGFVQPIVIDKNNEIIIGHCRYLSAKQLDLETVPALRVENLTEDEIKALRLADNKLNESEWDLDLALPELKGLDIELQELTGFDKELLIEPEERDDEVPEVPETPRTVLGDIYELPASAGGYHRVMCGDSTMIDQVEKLMNGQKADMVFTDPPYGMNLDTNYTKIKPDTEASRKFQKAKGERTNKNYSRVIGDDKEWEFESANHFDCPEQFWWGADWYRRTLPVGGSFFVWDKRENDDGSNLDSMFGSCFELCWSKTRHKREIARIKYAGLLGTEREDVKKRLHPTQKPVLLGEWFINKFSKENQLIADIFLGSGSTLIACEKTERVCYGMELDEHYVDVIVQRYVDYTGNTKIKLNGQEITWDKTETK